MLITTFLLFATLAVAPIVFSDSDVKEACGEYYNSPSLSSFQITNI